MVVADQSQLGTHGSDVDVSVIPTYVIIRPSSLLAGTATPAIAYRRQIGTSYRYETPTTTQTPLPPPTPAILEEPEAGTPAPVWPFIIGGVGSIVTGCVLVVVDRTPRATRVPEEPML